MTDTGRVQTARSYNAYGNDQTRALMTNRRGTLDVMDFMTDATDHGNVFVANRGTATTPISFAKTAYDADQPQLVVDVPAGFGIIPIYLEVVLEDAAGTDNEVIWSVSDGLIGAGTSTTVTPANAKVSAGGSDAVSSCTVRRDYTANGTAPSNGYEFARFTYPFANATTDPVLRFLWAQKDAGWAPVIEGTGALVLHVDGTTTAPSGYATAVWFEYGL